MSTHCLQPPSGLVSAVFIDHVRAAFRESAEVVERVLLDLFADHWGDVEVPMVVGEADRVVSDQAGNFGEARTWRFRGLPVFRMFTAGRSTRGVGHWLIDGSSCRLVRDSFWPALADIGRLRAWSLKRVDQSVDDDSGLLSVEVLRGAYVAGLLSHQHGGAPRKFDARDPLRGTAPTGWTVYLGERTGAWYTRIYDKVSEVRAKRGDAAAALLPVKRVRLEVERKSVKGSAPLVWDMVSDPAPYFAADCPLLAMRAGGVEPIRVGRVVRDQAEAALWVLLGHCRNSYGPSIEQAFWALGGTDEAAVVLLAHLRRPGSRAPVPGVAEVVGGGVPDREFVPNETA